MAASSTFFRSNPNLFPNPTPRSKTSFLKGSGDRSVHRHGFPSALILRFPPNFVHQLSTKARRNCSNIGVAQIVAASWTSTPDSDGSPLSAAADDNAVVVPEAVEGDRVTVTGCGGNGRISSVGDEIRGLDAVFGSDGSLLVHAALVLWRLDL